MVTGYEPLNTLKQIDENIWIVDGPHIKLYGLPFSTRMTIIRLNNGDLFVHSPIALTDNLKAEVEALGHVRHLVSPNWIHYAYISDWQKAFEGTVAWASPNVEARAAKKKVDIQFDRDLGDTAQPEWADDIEQVMVRGSKIHIEAVFLHKASKTLILTDLIENFESKKLPFVLRILLPLAGVLDPNGQMPRDMRMTFRRGRKQLRAAIEQMIEWAPERILIAHGRWYERDAVAELRRAFHWILK